MKVKREELYDILNKSLDGSYSVGMHGICEDRVKYLNNGISVEEATRRIVNNGLKVFSARTINGTVFFFGRMDFDEGNVKDELAEYVYSSAHTYVIVAIPSTLKTESGKELFIGTPNLESDYKNHFDTTGSEKTTMLEYTILENETLNPEFIMGTITDLDDGYVEYKENPGHISKKGGYVSEEFYNKACNSIRYSFFSDHNILRILKDFRNVSEEEIDELIKQYEDVLNNSPKDFLYPLQNEASVLETLKQLKRERRLLNTREEKRKQEDIQSEENKQEYLNEFRTFLTNEFGDNEIYLHDINFVLNAFKYLEQDELQMFIQEFSDRFPKEVFEDRRALKSMVLVNPSLLENSPLKDDTDFMIELSNTKGVSLDVIRYAGKSLLSNEKFIISLLLNTDNLNSLFASTQSKYHDSDFSYRDILGIDILNNRMFWELMNGLIRSKFEGLKQFDAEKEMTISNKQKSDIESSFNIPVNITKEDFYNYGKMVVIKFDYQNQEQKIKIRDAYEKSMIKKYGVTSDHDAHILPYLVDDENGCIKNFDKTASIGGIGIPEDLIEDVLRELVEEHSCIIRHGDLEIKDKFDKDILDQILKQLDEIPRL